MKLLESSSQCFYTNSATHGVWTKCQCLRTQRPVLKSVSSIQTLKSDLRHFWKSIFGNRYKNQLRVSMYISRFKK
jgi:hypothetical protein